jgi:hypothetical protein
MSWELYYTSAARGLNPHSHGFCTVARTEGMPRPVVERLESLSNYEPVFSAGSGPAAERQPVAWAHWRIPVGARTRSVLSRVAFVQSDISGRPGKFAHHLLLEPGEHPPAGPAWTMLQPGVMEAAWTDEPMMLPPRPLSVDGGATAAGPSGAGWPARLAQAFRDDPEKPAYLIYEPGLQLLPMLNEAIHLLPESLRWLVTFNTYFAELPAGLSCSWRCVIAKTPAASAARKSTGTVIDLTHGAGGK